MASSRLSRSFSIILTLSFFLSISQWAFGDHDQVKLPENLRPVQYDLTLRPDMHGSNYKGHVRIQFHRNQPLTTNRLLLHADHRIVLKSVKFHNSDDGNDQDQIESVEISNIERDNVNQLIILDLGDISVNLSPVLEISFESWIRDDGIGLFGYLDRVYSSRYLMSRLSPAYARYLFPCFDEPKYRAKIFLRFELPTDGQISALSNENPTDVTTNDDFKVIRFEMKRLVAPDEIGFIIGDFSQMNSEFSDKKFNMFHRASLRDLPTLMKFNESVSSKWVSPSQIIGNMLLDNYYDHKINLVLLPDLPDHLVTDSFGLIVYKEPELEVPSVSSNYVHHIAYVMSKHLVRASINFEWPRDCWFYEGLASWLSFEVVESIIPRSRYRSNVCSKDIPKALDVYAQPNFPQLRGQGSNTFEWNPMSPNYEVARIKSLSLFRMIEQYCGKFMILTLYHATFKYRTLALLSSLIQTIENSCRINFASTIEVWLDKPGVPLVNIDITNEGHLILKQEILYSDGTEPSPNESSWPLPVSVLTEKAIRYYRLFQRGNTFEEKITNVNDHMPLVKLNQFIVGFYRVKYSDRLFDRLIEYTQTRYFGQNSDEISVSDRTNLIDDSRALFEVGKWPAHQLLKLISFTMTRRHALQVSASLRAYKSVLKAYYNTSNEELIRTFGLNLFKISSDFRSLLRHNTDSIIATQVRSSVGDLMVNLGEPREIKSAIELFKYISSGENLDKYPLRYFQMFTAVVLSGDRNDLNTLINWFIEHERLREKIVEAFAYSQDIPFLLNITDIIIRVDTGSAYTKYLSTFFLNCLQNPSGRIFLKENIFNLRYLAETMRLLRGKEFVVIEYCLVMWTDHPELCNHLEDNLRGFLGESVREFVDKYESRRLHLLKVQSNGSGNLRRFLEPQQFL